MKYKIFFLLFSFLFVAFIFYSCSEDDNPITPDENDKIIYGKVVDEQGNPVAGVNVHYVPLLVDTSLGKVVFNPLVEVKIVFSLPIETNVTLVLLEHLTRDTLLYLLNNELLSAGAHSVNFDANSLTNGIYHYVIKYDTTLIENKFLLYRTAEELTNSNPLTTTDNNGNFQLSYDQLGIGDIFGFTSEVSPEIIFYKAISDSLQIFLTKQNYNNHLEQIKVDTNFAFKKTFTLTKP